MGVTSSDLKNLVITSLSEADPTALAGLTANVPKYWNLWSRQGVLPELQYWYVRREAIRYLMACVNQQIDYALRTQSASRNMTASSRQDASMSASGSEIASSNADRSASSNYADATNSTGSGSSVGNRNSSQSMTGSGSLLDNGSGSNTASQSSSFSSSSTVNASSSDTTAAQRYTNREVCGDHTRTHSSEKDSIGIPPLVVTTNVATGEVEAGTITETQSAQGDSSYNAKQDDLRVNVLAQSSLQSSSSSFNAHRIASDSMSSSGAAHMSASSASNFSSSGSGAGTMSGTGAGGSTMAYNSTRTAHIDGEAHRVSNSASQANSTMERLHQRFLHLQELWTKANEMIKWFEKQRLNLAPYTLQAIIIQYPAGINADSANQYLIRTPFGTGQGR